MKKDKTEILLIVDRSGSMSLIKNDMEGGFKTFLEKQKLEVGECYITLNQFDDQFETVYQSKDIKAVDGITINPRGSTALYDAVGKSINELGIRLNNLKEDDKPETVLVITITDGQENASKEFTHAKLKEMIKHQEEKYSWKFIFLGANINAEVEGAKFGLNVNNSMSYSTTKAGIDATFANLSKATSYMRSSNAYYSFTAQDKAESLDTSNQTTTTNTAPKVVINNSTIINK